MATTKRSDLVIVTEVLQDTIAAGFSGMKALNGSRAVVMNGSLGSNVGGDTVKVPYFDTLGEMEDVTEGDALTPEKITETSEEATVKHAGKAFEATYWSMLAAKPGSDPYQEATRQFLELAERKVDKELITVARASLPAMTIDVYSTSTPRTIDYDLAVDGKMLFGDEQMDIELMVVHSKVYGDMQKLKDADGRALLTEMMGPDGGKIPYFCGIPVKVSDRLTPEAGVYTTLILKRNALVFWWNSMPSVDQDKDILADSRITAIHMYYVAYRYKRLPNLSKGGVVILKHN